MEALRADDTLRRFLLREPRGSVAQHANLIVPSTRDDCAAGYVIMEPTEYPAMSGSNTICVATVLLEEGLVPMVEPETVVRLEAPAGPVEIRARCRDGRVESVEIENVPSFPAHLGAPLEVEGLGTIRSTSPSAACGTRSPTRTRSASRSSPRRRANCATSANGSGSPRASSCSCVHPENPGIAGVSIVQLAEPFRGVGETMRNAVVVAPGRLDRSATGTGLSARLSVLHARGLLRVGEGIAHASVIGSVFEGRIVREEPLGIVPAIRGSAFVTGRLELYVDPLDPFPEGYLLPDTWPGSDTQL